MLVIPTGTDAPIYHWPYVTVGLICLNVALTFLVPPVASEPHFDDDGEIVAGADDMSPFERYSLAIGDGRLHPVQWVSHNFLHFGWLHLAENMLFLWAFGIVVEGKLGPLKYLAAYLAIGTLHGAFVQLLLLHSGMNEHAAGASAVIYGLLAICMIWAPRNELSSTVIFLIGFRILVFQWELYYTTVALFYIGTQLLSFGFWGALGGMLRVSELGHLSGAIWGAAIGVLLLKLRLVDCEGWDVFSLWAKDRKLARDWKRRGELLGDEKPRRKSRKGRSRGRESDAPRQGYESQAAEALATVRSLTEEGDFAGAVEAYREAAKTLFDWPSQADLYALIRDLHARGAEAESVPLMRDHCRNFPAGSAKVRLKLAQVLIRECGRPAAALKVLREFPAGSLPPELERAREKLAREAARQSEDGPIEVESDE